MGSKLWKNSERRLAFIFGSIRNGATGDNSSDFDTPLLSAEVKERETVPNWLQDAVTQAVANAKPGRIPVVMLHRKGDRYEDGIVLLRVGDMKRLVDLLEIESASLDLSE